MRFETLNEYIHSLKHMEHYPLLIANGLVKGWTLSLQIVLNQLSQPLPLFFIVHPLSLRFIHAPAKSAGLRVVVASSVQ